jgi:hypothetical protein
MPGAPAALAPPLTETKPPAPFPPYRLPAAPPVLTVLVTPPAPVPGAPPRLCAPPASWLAVSPAALHASGPADNSSRPTVRDVERVRDRSVFIIPVMRAKARSITKRETR